MDQHSLPLRSGGWGCHCSLALAGYPNTQIQNMGRWWWGAFFKEYIQDKLACFSSGMSWDMKQKFWFVNVSGNSRSVISLILSSMSVQTTHPQSPIPMAAMQDISALTTCHHLYNCMVFFSCYDAVNINSLQELWTWSEPPSWCTGMFINQFLAVDSGETVNYTSYLSIYLQRPCWHHPNASG